ncbi:MAG: heavy metal translocating P-type ATPase [Oscillospiraceae bacterium]
MNYTITSDIPGRIRLRCGRFVFSKAQGSSIEVQLAQLPYVHSAKASCQNGSLLLFYSEGARGQLLAAVQNLRLAGLVPVPATEQQLEQSGIDAAFARQLAGAVGWHLFRRFLLPAPLRYAFTLFRAIGFWRRGAACLKKGKIGVEVLDAAAVGASIVQGNFSTAASIMLLGISELLENYTIQKTKSMLTSSLVINADSIWVEQGGTQRKIPMAELKIGDTAIVHAGSVIPIDGEICGGEAVINEASMTGEPLGVFKKTGDSVFAGTAIEDGTLQITVRALESNTRISQIVDMIGRSENLKANIQGKAKRIADGIVPFSFLLSLGVLVFTQNLTKALSVLLVDYSCAIKLATPIAVISAMREASGHQIVVKGGKFFEAMAEADTIVFDKTGTLTVASPRVSKVVSLNGLPRNDVLRLAACMEEHFPHSVARAIVRQAQEENLHHEEEHTEVEYIVAHGIATTIHQKRAIIGSYHFVFEDEKIPLSKEDKKIMEKELGGDSAIYLAVDGKVAGFICITDPARPEAAETIAALKGLGIKEVVMLTGDSASAARVVCRQLGISRCHAQILPQDKAAIVEALKKEGRKVIMVGDGINDSPALAAADVSVSMKDSSDIAREVADITLLSSNLAQLVTLRRLSQRLMRRINSNFRFIVGFNTLLLALGIGNVLTPAASALLHNLSTMGISAASTRPCLNERDRQQDAEALGEGAAWQPL